MITLQKGHKSVQDYLFSLKAPVISNGNMWLLPSVFPFFTRWAFSMFYPSSPVKGKKEETVAGGVDCVVGFADQLW
ncbi:hypothetical protein RIF29_16245 [Crotalaria pallida]|uniref:Uncharacterized protein n=1 Tax=Crotalaria pallida TaxID=3830 RepID=A0AAN9IDD5_CROPI